MNQILYSENNNNSNKKILIILAILLVIIVISIFTISNMLKDKILANVYVGDVNIGMQNKDKAKDMILPNLVKYENYNITLSLEDRNLTYTAKDLGINIDDSLNNVLDNAYTFGRDGSFFSNSVNVLKSYFSDNHVLLQIKFDDEKFNSALNKLIEDNEIIASDDSYEIKDNKIYIHKGTDGNKIDYELAKTYIATAMINDVKNVEVPIIESSCKKIDFEKLYDEVYVAPQNASILSGDSFEVALDKAGVFFDLEDAKSEYNKTKAGEDFIIDLKEIEAEIKVSDLENELFKNVLSTFSSSYDETVTGRVQNLKVAAERCNGTILYPGDEFSYNKALGTRTVANGFAPGHSFAAGGRVVTTIGGGICQVSSALYNVVLEADLEVTNRVAHGMYVQYVKPSLDATVVDGVIDFKFKNNRKYPVKIEASAENGTVTVTLYGIKEKNEPIIEIESVILETIPYKTIKENDSTMKKGTTKVVQEPVDGYVSEAYRIEKDSNGKEISRTLISKDKYIATNEIIKVGTKTEQPVVTATPKPVEPEPTVPVTTPENKDDDDTQGLPPGWDSPESPYSHGN